MKKLLYLFSLCCIWNLTASGDDNQPFLQYVFNHKQFAARGFLPVGKEKTRWIVRGNTADADAGGLICKPGNPHRMNFGKFRPAEASVKIDFIINASNTKQQALFCYYESSWGVQMFGIYLTADKRLRVLFNGSKEQPKKKMDARSEPLNLVPGKNHSLLVTVVSGGTLQAFFDGQLVLEENNACGFGSFTAPPGDQWHPFATIGSTWERCKDEQFLSGIVTGFELHKKIIAPQLNSNFTDCVTVMKKIASPLDIDGKTDEAVYRSAIWTKPFDVLGAESQNVNGLWLSADNKFVRNASRAVMFYDDRNFYVTIRSPFPAGMKLKTGSNEAWMDDCVEFFIQPNEKDIYQVLASSTGNFSTYKYEYVSVTVPWKPAGVKVAGHTSGNVFTVEMQIPFAELGMEKIQPGMMFRGNFAREGASCGGLSTWSPVGTRFISPAGFGRLIVEDSKLFFKNERRKLADELKQIKLSPIAISETNAALEKLDKVIETEGGNITAWNKLNNQLINARNSVVKAINSGKTAFIWQNDTWSDFEPDVKIPFGQKELSVLQLASPRGARAAQMFLVTNLTGKTALYNLNVKSKNKNFRQLLRFRQVEFVELAGGRLIPDPILDLPIGSVIRIAPNETAVFIVDVDCSKLPAGTCNADITMVSGRSGISNKSFKLQLKVSPVDVSTIKMPVWAYPLRWPKHIEKLSDFGFNTACLLPTVFAPSKNKAGKYDFSEVDKVVEAFRKNGIAPGDIYFLLYAEWPRWSRIRLDNGKLASFMEPGWAEEYGKRLKLFRDYVKEKYNISYDQYALYTNDEPYGDPDDPKSSAYHAIKGAEFVRSVDPGIKLFTNPWRPKKGSESRFLEVFDMLAPGLNRIRSNPQMLKAYKESGKYIFSYSVLEKSNSPIIYRSMSWEHMKLGFQGGGTFYDLFDCAADCFNSNDKSSPKAKNTSDYQTCYRNNFNDQLTSSRRLEAWYQGVIDMKLEKFCRQKITASKDKQAEKDLQQIIDRANVPGADFDKCRAELLQLAEKLLKK